MVRQLELQSDETFGAMEETVVENAASTRGNPKPFGRGSQTSQTGWSVYNEGFWNRHKNAFGIEGTTAMQPLAIVSTSPVEGATTVDMISAITVTFNRNIVLNATGSIQLYRQEGASSVLERTWDLANPAYVGTGAGQVFVSGATLTIRAAASRIMGRPYSLLIQDNTVRDAAGAFYDALSPVPVLTFSTGAAPAVEYSFAHLGRSNVEYGMYTTKNAYQNNTAVIHSSPKDSTKFMYFGQNDEPTSPIISMPITTATTAHSSTHRYGMINACVAEEAAWFEAIFPNYTANFLDLARQGRGITALLNPTITTAGRDFSMAKLREIIAASGMEPSLVIVAWDGIDKRNYLRKTEDPGPAPAYTPPTNVTSLWDLNIPDGTTGSTPPPLFSTNTKLLFVPQSGLDVRPNLLARYTDPDWQRILVGDFDDVVGLYSAFYSHGGHAYSNVPAGQALMAHTQFIPQIASYMHSIGKLSSGLEMPGRLIAFVEGPSRAYIDVHVSLVNGGVIQRTDTLWGITPPTTRQADDQDWNWFGIQRFGEADSAMTPFMRLGSASYTYKEDYRTDAVSRTVLASHRGTVTLQNAGQTLASVTTSTDEVVTGGRWATFRITPEVPFAQGDRLLPGIHWSHWLNDELSSSGSIDQFPLRFPRESVPHITDMTLLRPFAGLDLESRHPYYLF